MCYPSAVCTGNGLFYAIKKTEKPDWTTSPVETNQSNDLTGRKDFIRLGTIPDLRRSEMKVTPWARQSWSPMFSV